MKVGVGKRMERILLAIGECNAHAIRYNLPKRNRSCCSSLHVSPAPFQVRQFHMHLFKPMFGAPDVASFSLARPSID